MNGCIDGWLCLDLYDDHKLSVWDGVTSILGGLFSFLWHAHTEPFCLLLLKVRQSSATIHFFFFSFTSVIPIYHWTCQGEKYYTHHYPSNTDRSRKLVCCWIETELHTMSQEKVIWIHLNMDFSLFCVFSHSNLYQSTWFPKCLLECLLC